MRRPCSILVLFVLLVFGASLVVPAEDAPETAYDESETLPYEGAPLFSITEPQASPRIAKAELSCESLLRFNPSTKRGKRRREDNEQSHCVPDSLTILDHAFRC